MSLDEQGFLSPDLEIFRKKIREKNKFYFEFIGLKLAMDMGWILTFISKSNPIAQINIPRCIHPDIDNSNFAISIEVPDVDKLYEIALLDKWEVRGFFVKDPNGVTVKYNVSFLCV